MVPQVEVCPQPVDFLSVASSNQKIQRGSSRQFERRHLQPASSSARGWDTWFVSAGSRHSQCVLDLFFIALE